MPDSKSPGRRKTHKRAVRRDRTASSNDVANPPDATKRPRLLDRVRAAIRVRHLSPRTEKAYIGWIKRFIFFNNKHHPDDMGEDEPEPEDDTGFEEDGGEEGEGDEPVDD